MYKVVITGSQLPNIEAEVEALKDIAIVSVKNCSTKKELLALTKDADVIMTDSEIIDAEVLDNAPSLRTVVEYGIGVNNIDVEAATARGIMICNVPDVYISEVAEHAALLMLAVSRNLLGMSNSVMKEQRWDFNYMPARKLTGKVLGIIGCGKIGRALGKIAKGMNMKVLAYDAYLDDAAISKLGYTACSFDELLEAADVISLHVPYTNETHHLIGANEIEKMKPQAILINVSRGGIVDEVALSKALKAGKLFGAALDVLEHEPCINGNPLLDCGNVIITPHMGWKSETAAEALEMAAVKEVRSVLIEGTPINLVNKGLLL